MKRIARHQLISAAVMLAAGATIQAAVQPQQASSFKQADLDGNGAVSFSEAQQSLNLDQQQFNRVDADRNQHLDPQEFEQARMQMEQQQGSKGKMQTQGSEQTERQAGGTDIQVQEQPAKIEVTQPNPEITVKQHQPEVTIQQPRPKVEVQMPEPRVTVKQAQPQVKVVEQGQPEVKVETAEQAEVTYEQGTTSRQKTADQNQTAGSTGTQSQADSGSQSSQHSGSDGLGSKRVADIEGMQVINLNNDEIGEVQKVVQDPQSNRLFAVVSVGGFLGIGDKDVPIALQRMEWRDGQLVLPSDLTGDELQNHPRYRAADYRELSGDRLLSQTDGSSSGERSKASFTQIDRNNDGHITRQEAMDSEYLRNDWQRADTDQNQRIDRAEFSAFEQQSGPQ